MAITAGTFIIEALGGAVLASGPLDLAAIASADFVVTAGVTQVVGSVALVGGLVGLNAALASRPQAASTPQFQAQSGYLPLRQSIPPRMVTLGRARVAGAYELYESLSGASYDVTLLNHGRIGGFVRYYFHDDEIFVNPDGTLDTSNAGWTFIDGRYDSQTHIYVFTRLGLSTETAYSQIVSEIPSLWTSAHRGDGQASMGIICRNVPPEVILRVYPRGHPEPSAVIDGTLVFDPRDGSQNRSDPTTWKVSYNPVINTVFFVTDEERGMGIPWETAVEPVLSDLIDQADICDELVAKKDGTQEARYSCGGTYNLDGDPAEVIAGILASCDGWMCLDDNSRIALVVGKYQAPTVTFSDKHLVEISVQRGIADKDVVNKYELSFTSPANKYKKSPGDPWVNQYGIDTRGKTRTQNLDIPWVQSHSQLRRLAKRAMARQETAIRGKFTTNLYGLAARGHRWINVNFTKRRGLENAVIEISQVEYDLLGGKCTFDWVLVDPSTIDLWNPTAEEGTEPPVPDESSGSGAAVPQNVAAVVEEIIGIDGTASFRTDVSWDDPARADLAYIVRFRMVDDGSGSPGAWSQTGVSSPSLAAGRYTASIYPTNSSLFEVQVASTSTNNRSDWSASAFIAAAYPSLNFFVPQDSGLLSLI